MEDKHIRVLLIEDNPADARLIHEMLAELGGAEFDLECVDHLSSGLERLVQGGIDLILLDLSLPDSQGLDTFVKLFAQAPGVPIIALTGLEDEALAIRAVREGAQDYLVKGQVNSSLLVRAMRYAIERKQAQGALLRLSSVVDAMVDGVTITDLQGRITYLNKAVVQQLGYKKEDLIGKTPTEFIAEIDKPEFAEEMKKSSLGNWTPKSNEYLAMNRDGLEVPVSISFSVLHDHSGKPKEIIAVSRDITKRKRAEEEKVKLERQLHQAQKMEAIGTLASGIAHDFNNFLGGILGYASLLLSKLPTEDANRKYLEHIERAGSRAAQLTNRLLGFARQGKYEVKPVDINQMINQAAELLSASIDKSTEIKTDLCKESPFTEGDANQLEQVLMNLCVNARDAMPDGGELFIRSRLVHLDEGFVSQHLGATAGDYICISVSDTGEGMDKETKAKIFEPFYTTKEKGEGTGLGLSMVYGIVKNHGGYISVYSEVGKGTTLRVYLPVSQGSPTPPRQGVEESISGSESILVVDDEEILRDLMKDLLGALGYEVMLASNGEEAVEVYREHKEEIDLVIVDMVMPKMGGKKTYEELKRIDPGVKALLASGYSQNRAAQQILNLGVKGFLHKPFSVQEISCKVREVLKLK